MITPLVTEIRRHGQPPRQQGPTQRELVAASLLRGIAPRSSRPAIAWQDLRRVATITR